MFLSRRSNGVYYLWFINQLGVRQKVSTKSRRKSDALKFFRSFKESDVRHREQRKIILLSEFKNQYLQHSKSIHTPNSHSGVKTILQIFLAVVGDRPMARIGVREIELFLYQQDRTLTDFTIRKYYATLASAFETSRRWGYISMNPFALLRRPKVREVQPSHFTREEFATLMKNIQDPSFRQLCTFAVSTGLRISELISLRWCDVDFSERQIQIQNSDTFTTKSKRNRVVPICGRVLQLLLEMKQGSRTELVFHRDGEKLKREELSKQFKAYVIASGLSDKLHFHSLRHTFATWLVQSGVSIYEVQKLLGHSSISVTQVYSHLAACELHSAVNKIDLNLN